MADLLRCLARINGLQNYSMSGAKFETARPISVRATATPETTDTFRPCTWSSAQPPKIGVFTKKSVIRCGKATEE